MKRCYHQPSRRGRAPCRRNGMGSMTGALQFPGDMCDDQSWAPNGASVEDTLRPTEQARDLEIPLQI